MVRDFQGLWLAGAGMGKMMGLEEGNHMLFEEAFT